jgi:long-chain acyl-CoA synthetase
VTAKVDINSLRPPLEYPAIAYHQLLRRSAEKFGDKPAVIFHDTRLSFRELDDQVNRFAHALASLGVKKGDRVGIYMMNRPEYLVSFNAVARAGAVVTPLNPAYREREIEYQLRDSEARVLITHEALYPVVEASARPATLEHVVVVGGQPRPGAHIFEDLVGRHPATPPAEVTFDLENDLVALPYSSGTTGLPKGVMLTQRNLVSNHYQKISAARFTPDDRILIFLPFYHIYGAMLMGASLAAGVTQVIMERFELEPSLELTERHRITLYYAVPPVLIALANYPDLEKFNLRSVRFMMSGAAPLPPEVGRRVMARIGAPLRQGYGLTEASPLTHANPLEDELAILESVGLRVSDQEERVVDIETGTKTLGPGEVGEVILRGPHIMKGYWKSPEETARTIRGGWLYTGDIGYFNEDGYLFIVDRKKEMIKYKGFGIAPAELEATLFQHPAVADCAVIGKADDEAGQIPKAFVVVKKGATLTAEELMDFSRERLAHYKQIREVEFLDAIPKNPSGKILRRVLIERERSKPSSQG